MQWQSLAEKCSQPPVKGECSIRIANSSRKGTWGEVSRSQTRKKIRGVIMWAVVLLMFNFFTLRIFKKKKSTHAIDISWSNTEIANTQHIPFWKPNLPLQKKNKDTGKITKNTEWIEMENKIWISSSQADHRIPHALWRLRVLGCGHTPHPVVNTSPGRLTRAPSPICSFVALLPGSSTLLPPPVARVRHGPTRHTASNIQVQAGVLEHLSPATNPSLKAPFPCR